ncbi:hypothetical protein [Streptomyces fuscichromogenes]|uniref:Uncharacterized protein n=1 Tax=Streptomyces fuscichromogenes TaxID=1324013 RepID=A0A918CQG7_9ACTN|nr:hypothetical protein [Streptomyces fuscichromogenes]GGN02540.1 hypothetical protein GCM10011578_025020 [Streptomyces fuscichromogenes]
MSSDPYAVLRALLRAEAVRSTPKPEPKTAESSSLRPRPQEQKRG